LVEKRGFVVSVINQYLKSIKNFNRNIKLYLVATTLINFGFGVFYADFNLYILSLGMTPDFLGVILSLAPFAEGLSSIPIGFLAEKIGFKRSLIMVYIVLGAAYFIQVISPNRSLIMLGSVMVGMVAGGNFIIQLPFLSQYTKDDRNQAFTLTMLVFYITFAIGGLIGGYLPTLMNTFILDEILTYRILLAASSLMIVLGAVPMLFVEEDKPDPKREISLAPYLKKMDANTIKFAITELFVGASLAFIASFLNIIFVYYFHASMEFYGTTVAILVIPITLFLFLGPTIAEKLGNLRTVLISRVLTTFLAYFVVMTTNPYFGAGSFILYRSLFGFAQSLWFSFAVSVSSRRSRMATSTWLEITFQIGMGIAALVGGNLIGRGSYTMLGIISAASMVICFLLTYVFFGKDYLTPVKKEIRMEGIGPS
jgi:predicted MFS family arabinose efflux permease